MGARRPRLLSGDERRDKTKTSSSLEREKANIEEKSEAARSTRNKRRRDKENRMEESVEVERE